MTGDGFGFAALEAEHALTTNRALLLMTLQRSNETLAQVQRINGTVARAVIDIAGLDTRVESNEQTIRDARTVARTLKGLLSLLGVTNAGALLFLILRSVN